MNKETIATYTGDGGRKSGKQREDRLYNDSEPDNHTPSKRHSWQGWYIQSATPYFMLARIQAFAVWKEEEIFSICELNTLKNREYLHKLTNLVVRNRRQMREEKKKIYG